MRPRCLHACLLILGFAACPRAFALLTFDDGKDQVYVNANYTFGYDSNVFTQAVARGSTTESESFAVTYSRRAGLISVDAGASWNFGTFSQLPGEDFSDPGYSITFSKGTGRTTGTLGLSAQKIAEPDPDANNRSVSWDYGATLETRYPINERYYFTNTAAYSGIFYTDTHVFSDLDSWSDGLNINYVYDSKLDLSGGWTFGRSTTPDTLDYDTGVNIGATGTILPKLTGSIAIGIDNEDTYFQGNSTAAAYDDHYQDLSANAGLNWALTKTISVTNNISRGFSTTSTDISIDETSVSLATDVPLTKRLRGNFTLDYAGTQFLGLLGAGRRDTLWELTASATTALTTHVNISLTVYYEINYSNLSSAAFKRHGASININTKY